ncbi:heterokaryon incompatibility protein-domain-containing protein [Diplogelasinospora grovesii]|uniref:Heterokaryon incompatibility protein-domain-containing protein n=1 Tax=Diplogelasinospora grovesii TaxID=303347 RepID=A0AAN6MVZ7_9PEZI|nr:heterokaryon incompatibility protein-domain-containing protein [Diplogelasinospora grovesii]
MSPGYQDRLKDDLEVESKPPPWLRNKIAACAVCHDLELKTFRHQPIDPASLVRSAEAKACLGCMTILEALTKFHVDMTSLKLEQPPQDALLVTGDLSGSLGACQVKMGELILGIYASSGKPRPIPNLSPATEVSGHTGSDATMARILDWMGECTGAHCDSEQFPSNTDMPLPHRILDISFGTSNNDSPVRLVEGFDRRGTYACLSHCWGSTPLIQTVKANYEQHKAGIGFDRLPKTFQDAIEVARALGIFYLWIDSLCIIQDDTDDWMKEAALMASIYKNGRVTIAASNAKGSTDGCFMDTSDYLCKELSVTDADNKQYYARARRWIEHGEHGAWPLMQRGWVLQERLLSPRFLHFGHAEVVWECRETMKCECSRCRIFEHVLSQGSRELWARKWRELVADYATLSLTFAKDVFPALSGAAKEFQRHRGGPRYVAGLWEDSLVEDLLWYIRSDVPKLLPARPTEWRSPTWSWAVVCRSSFSLSCPPYLFYWDTGYLELIELEHTYVTVEETSVTPSGLDPMGQIKTAHIVLKGPVLDAKLGPPSGGRFNYQDLRIVGYTAANDEQGEQMHPQFLRDYCIDAAGRGLVTTGTLLTCLKMASDPIQHNMMYYLVLRWVDGATQAFERIGFMELTEASRCAHLEREMTVKIVQT